MIIIIATVFVVIVLVIRAAAAASIIPDVLQNSFCRFDIGMFVHILLFGSILSLS